VLAWARRYFWRGGTRGNVANRGVRHRRRSARALFQAAERPNQAGRVASGGRLAAAIALRVWIAAFALICLGGCATAEAPTLASRLVRQGTPTINLGGTAPRRALMDPEGAPRARPIEEVSRYSSSGAAVETQDPQLRQALLALSLSPSTEHYLAVAGAYRRLGILDRAYDHLQRGAELDPQSAAVHDALARVWRDWGLPQFGLSSAHRAVHAAPRSATARHTLGTVLYALGLRKEAQLAFQETVALDPRAWYAWQNLCTLAMAEGRTKEAITLCRHAADTRPASIPSGVGARRIGWPPAQRQGRR